MGKLKDTLIIDTDICVDSSGTTAVDATYFWQPLETCPRGVKVQLLGKGGVAMYGIFNGRDEFYTHWAPLPKKPRVEMTDFKIQPAGEPVLYQHKSPIVNAQGELLGYSEWKNGMAGLPDWPERSLYTRPQQLNSELLKALKALVSSAERVSVGEYDEETLDINLSKARAAIKKVTGEKT